MSYLVQISPQAVAQIRSAANWWLENRPKAPDAFAEEIERSFELVSALPSAGEPVLHPSLRNVRRVLLGRVRYHLYYCVSPDTETVDVLALWHTSRGTAPKL